MAMKTSLCVPVMAPSMTAPARLCVVLPLSLALVHAKVEEDKINSLGLKLTSRVKNPGGRMPYLTPVTELFGCK